MEHVPTVPLLHLPLLHGGAEEEGSPPRGMKVALGVLLGLLVASVAALAVAVPLLLARRRHAAPALTLTLPAPVPAPAPAYVAPPPALAPAHVAPPPPPAPAPAPPPPHYDDVRRVPTPEPYDEPRWPRGPYPADYGFYGYGAYGGGGVAPDGHYYRPGELAGLHDTAFAGYDSPTAVIMHRPTDPVGPWTRVGALTAGDGSRVLPLFARQRGRSSWNNFNYRTVVSDVPVELGGTRSDWINNGDWLAVPGASGSFSAQIYEEYR